MPSAPAESRSSTATHCPYCALQCGMHLIDERESRQPVTVVGNSRYSVTAGGLCVKGWFAAATLDHPERLTTPLVRAEGGRLEPSTWEAALARVAERFGRVQHQHGPDAVAVFGGGSLTNEKAYLLGKFARVALGTANIDYNGRFCMSSAAAAQKMAFGIDRGLPFPLADIASAKAILLVGSNVAETMPPIMRYFEAQQIAGGKLIVADPRRTPTAEWAACHLPLRPGSDAALANGLLHILVRDNLIAHDYIRERTDDFDEVRRVVAGYWPERVETLTGVPERLLVEAARILGTAGDPMVLTARGAEQQAHGVQNTLAYINVALALGAVGRRSAGFGTITGQGNGQGGREHGQRADQLPGYRRIDDPVARDHVAGIWGVPSASLPRAGLPALLQFDSIGREGGIRAMFVMGSNVAVSAPDATRVDERLRALDCLVVSDFFLSETAAMADVVLPSAQWAEEDGTMTNLEGRVIRRRRGIEPPSGVRTDLEILTGLAAALGKAQYFRHADAREVFEELRRASAGGLADYSGISYERLDEEEGVFWPCAAGADQGTPRLFTDSFPTVTGRARFHPVIHRSPVDACDADYPLHLTTGRVLAHYQSGSQTRRVEQLQQMVSEPAAEIHPATARRHRLTDGGHVLLTTRRGSGTFLVRVTTSIREDTVFVPFHWGGDRAINRLTSAAADPTSGMPEFKVCAARVEPASTTTASQDRSA